MCGLYTNSITYYVRGLSMFGIHWGPGTNAPQILRTTVPTFLEFWSHSRRPVPGKLCRPSKYFLCPQRSPVIKKRVGVAISMHFLPWSCGYLMQRQISSGMHTLEHMLLSFRRKIWLYWLSPILAQEKNKTTEWSEAPHCMYEQINAYLPRLPVHNTLTFLLFIELQTGQGILSPSRGIRVTD